MFNLGTDDEDLGTVFKFVVLGNEGVGKTSFVRRILRQRFRPKHHQTLYADIYVDERDDYSLLLYDIPGSIKLRKYRKHYFEKADGILFIFDITKELDMLQLSYWMQDLASTLDSTVNIAVIGNKTDLADQRELTYEFLAGTEIILIDQISPRSIKTFEVSVKKTTGVDDAFNWLIDATLKQDEEKKRIIQQVFQPSSIYSILFKLTDFGPADVYRDFNDFPFVEDTEVYLVNMGISIISAIGQGHNYSTGIFDMPDHGSAGYRRMIYSFRMPDSTAEDHRLSTGFFQLVLLIPNEYYDYYTPFSSVNNALNKFIAQISDYELFSQEIFNQFVEITLAEFHRKCRIL